MQKRMSRSRFTTLSAGIAVLVLLFAAGPANAAVTVNMTGGSSFSRGILGQCPIPGYRDDMVVDSLELAKNASVRGVAGGLDADTYNWKDLTDGFGSERDNPPITTLKFLRRARDYNTQVVLTANARGIGSGGDIDAFQYTDKSVGSLAGLAADWVRYTNYIVQNYRQGDTITVPGDAAILNALPSGRWSSGKLPLPGEPLPPKVAYWEIGNEPATNTGIYYYLSPEDYTARYKTITSAMLAQDPTIKVGLGCSLAPLSDSSARVDFIGWHPYGSVGDSNGSSASAVARDLRGVKMFQINTHQTLVSALQSNGRPANTPLVYTEWNPSSMQLAGYASNNSMMCALGIAETVFSYAELGISSAMYWIYPSSTNPSFGLRNNDLPACKTFAALRDHMGDTLVSSWYGNGIDAAHASNSSVRLYVTKDSLTGEVALWGLNFSDSSDATVTVDLNDLGFTTTTGTLMQLKVDPSYAQQLLNPTGSASEVYIDWQSTPLTSLNTDNLTLTLGHAGITLLVLSPLPEPSTIIMLVAGVLGLLAYVWRRRKQDIRRSKFKKKARITCRGMNRAQVAAGPHVVLALFRRVAMKMRSMVWLVVLGGAVAWANSASADIVAQYAGPTTFDGTSTEVTLPNVSIGLEGRVDLQFKPDGVAYGAGGWETNTGTLWCLADVGGGNAGQVRLQISNDGVIARIWSGTANAYVVNETIPTTLTTDWHTASIEWKQGQPTAVILDGTTTTVTNTGVLTEFTSTDGNHVVGALSANSQWYPSGFMSYFHGEIKNVVVQNAYSAVPEPAALVLLATGVFGLLAYAWRKRK
jgi:hypothetical protein